MQETENKSYFEKVYNCLLKTYKKMNDPVNKEEAIFRTQVILLCKDIVNDSAEEAV